MPLTDWLSRLAHVTGTPLTRLEDPAVLEDAVAELWLSGEPLDETLQATISAPPTLAQPEVLFAGMRWSRSLVCPEQLRSWGVELDYFRGDVDPEAPALGVPLELARELAEAQGGRLPRVSEWQAAVAEAAPGNHSLRWGGPSQAGAFPAARSGILDGWGNAWEWTEEGLAVGGSFASPPHPAPSERARLTSFRIVR